MSLVMATTQYLTDCHHGDGVTGQVMEPVSLTSHAQETLHYGIAVCVCARVCVSVRESECESTELAYFDCHVSFPTCCNSVIVQDAECVCVCVCIE